MKSMTGYGRGESVQDGYKITTELSSVNRKQSEITLYLPREIEPLESRIRNELNRRISRGRLTAKVSMHAGEDVPGGRVQVNVRLAKEYARELARVARELGLNDSVTIDHLMRAPGVLKTDDPASDVEHLWPAVEASVTQAADALGKMRTKEGVHLEKDLKKRMATLRKSVQRIGKLAPEMVARFREQLRNRVKAAGLEVPPLDDERLVKEIVYYADRSDISEELTRLQSHFSQFDDCLAATEPVGRTLDFLAQEMNREINTIGSKSMDSSISREVVNFKAELEKFREQVQNVE